MSTAPKIPAKDTTAKHPVRPRAAKLGIARAHEAIAQRYPKVLAELAK